MMTRTIISKGHVKEEVIPALIQVRNQLIINNKDVTNQLQTDNILKTITSQSGLSVEQIKLVEAYAKSEEWNKHMTSLTGMGGLVIAAIVTVCTMGAGAAIVGAAMEAANAAMATAIQTAIEAAVQAMVSQVATALLTSALTGESPNIDASSLIKSAVLSGVLSYTSNFTQLSDYGFDKGAYTTKIAQAGVNAGVKTAITGGNFKDNLINEAAQTIYTAVGDYSTQAYKESGADSAWSEGGINKVLLHTAVGAGVAAAKGENVLAGAASGAVAEIARPLTEDASKNVQTATSMLIGGITAGAVGGEASINVGSYIGQTSDQYNRQLHQDEMKKIKELASNDTQKEAKLFAASCALTKCYAEYPEGSDNYVKLKAIADAGSSSALASERQELLKTGMFTYTNGLWSDASKDSLTQINNTYQVTVRAVGGIEVVGGAMGIGMSVAAAPAACLTGVGCVADAYLAYQSADAVYTGTKQVINGQPQETFTSRTLQNLGLSQRK